MKAPVKSESLTIFIYMIYNEMTKAAKMFQKERFFAPTIISYVHSARNARK